jgi:hypothetical protein
MTSEELLALYRRIMDCIFFGGNIFYDKGRFEAYKIIASAASRLRTENGA